MASVAANLSPEMEDYLETIAALEADGGAARVTDIAERLGVRKPSVTQALRSLAAKGLLNYRPYVSPRLTADGRRVAERVQHRHDVIKQFLTTVLLVDEATAEANACRLEHAIDKDVLEHLAHFMDFVQRCPRGGAKWIRGYEYYCDPEAEREKCERCLQLALEDFQRKHPAPTEAGRADKPGDLAVGHAATGRDGRGDRNPQRRSQRGDPRSRGRSGLPDGPRGL